MKKKIVSRTIKAIPPDSSALLLTIPNVMSVLSMRVWPVRQLIAEGKLHAQKIGRSWFVTKVELDRYVTSLGEVTP